MPTHSVGGIPRTQPEGFLYGARRSPDSRPAFPYVARDENAMASISTSNSARHTSATA
jgi:hypothetical protein